VREHGADFVGLGRMVLSYPELPRDVLSGQGMTRELICRTFSDCTTAPRNGLVSGCYPIDPFYKRRPEAATLAEIKKGGRST
jgi:NADPH2 dehydrogenase